MDLLKSSLVFTAGDLLRSQVAEGVASKAVTGGGGVGEHQVGQALAAASLEPIDSANHIGPAPDQAEALILLPIWEGASVGYRDLVPSVAVPKIDLNLPAIEARNCFSNYVILAFR